MISTYNDNFPEKRTKNEQKTNKKREKTNQNDQNSTPTKPYTNRISKSPQPKIKTKIKLLTPLLR